ncbi:MAG: 30S ribosomal protein S7 [Nanoarchaeota archaeon]|mgnify:CR=1 FL=1
MQEIKLFNKWDTSKINVVDPGLKDYISLNTILIPKSNGRNRLRFHKSKSHIVERLINKVMIPGHRGKKHKLTSGHATGKNQNAINIVKGAFEIVEKKTNKNPVEVFVQAIENSAPREEITTIEYGGARYPQAVDCAPQRRIDIALRMMVQGSYQRSFGKKKNMKENLADEIIAAYNKDSSSAALSKKTELERQADSSR